MVFFLGVCYLTMLVTDWQVISPGSETYRIDSGYVSSGVKVVSSWLCFLLYSWSLIAPWLLPNRDFS